MRPRILILRGPGTNCNIETQWAIEEAGGIASQIHVNQLIKKPSLLHNYHMMVIPGGFTYGDDISAGKALATDLRQLKEEFDKFIDQRKLIIGICNGFQVLVKLGILPGFIRYKQETTLTWNTSGRFEDRWVYLKQRNTRCVFLSQDKVLFLPIAHAEGRLMCKNEILKRMEKDNMIVFKYCTQDGTPTQQYPYNPNGSINAIAGICDITGQVLGMMPHPERFIYYYQHPLWEKRKKYWGDGYYIFESAIKYLRGI